MTTSSLVTLTDFLALANTGCAPVVTFLKGIEDKAGYAEPGMRARVLRCLGPGADDIVKVVFDFEPFDEHNRLLESRNYYGPKGGAGLTARKAGYYHPQCPLYFAGEEKLKDNFEVESSPRVALFETYRQEAGERTYVQWLVDKVLTTRA